MTLVNGLRQLTLCAAVAASASAFAPAAHAADAAPILRSGDLIANQYIVVLKKDAVSGPITAFADTLALQYGGAVLNTYEHALKGFSVVIPDLLVEQLALNPAVDYIEQDVALSRDSILARLLPKFKAPRPAIFNWRTKRK